MTSTYDRLRLAASQIPDRDLSRAVHTLIAAAAEHATMTVHVERAPIAWQDAFHAGIELIAYLGNHDLAADWIGAQQ
jgi:hypothetical protein